MRWPRDPRAPRESCRTDRLPRSSADPEPPAARIPHIRAKAPLLLALATKPMRQSRAAALAEQLARAVASVVTWAWSTAATMATASDWCRSPDLTAPSCVDVAVADAPDPDMPNVTVRRARRGNPLEVMKRTGTINARENEAGGKVRAAIERSQPSLRASRGSRCTLHRGNA